MSTEKHTGAVYETKTADYAELNESKPIYDHYERPATLSLLPPLRNLSVLDAACGPGWYAEHLSTNGARVTAFDLNREFVDMTTKRIKGAGVVYQADLAEPLDFAPDNEFDLVLCPLAMHYLKDWEPTLREFHRILKLDGILVFSTHHPFSDVQLLDHDDYFAHECVEDEWEIGVMRFYRRSLTQMSEELATAGFIIERLLEARPTEGYRAFDEAGYRKLNTTPCHLVIKAARQQ